MTLFQALLIAGALISQIVLVVVIVTWEDWWPKYWDWKDRRRR